jgi:ubiquinone/menaquinone biosynthesis C-methylase UbiE
MKDLAKWLDDKAPKMILDVATGVGNFVQLLTSLYDGYTSIIGIDMSSYALSSATKNFEDNNRISFLEMDGTGMSFDDDSFDLVTLSNSLHHLSEPLATLEEMKRVVRKDGFILVSEMIANDLTKAQQSHLQMHHFAAEIDRYLGDTHNETYTEEELIQILSDMPVTVQSSWSLEVQQQEFTEEQINWLKQTLDRLVARVEDKDQNKLFQGKANQIKAYIDEHGFDSATTIIVVMTI